MSEKAEDRHVPDVIRLQLQPRATHANDEHTARQIVVAVHRNNVGRRKTNERRPRANMLNISRLFLLTIAKIVT